MKILQNKNRFISDMILNNSVFESYKASQFNILKNVEDKYILFNTLTRELVQLNDEEYNYYISKNFNKDENNVIFKSFKDKNFIVGSNIDELKRYKEVLVLYRLACKNTNTGIAQYKIFTTTYCNARCFYCFEEGMPQNHMSMETAEDVVQYIIKTRQADGICLYWFGGEPLCNVPVIDYICNRMNEENISFTSKIITNGYLFDENLVKKAVELWNLKFAQITLDGTEEEHNKRKAYIKPLDSPFKRTLRNIELLLKENVRVTSRLNFDENNMTDIDILIDMLHERFGDYNNFVAYPSVLSSNWLNHSSERAGNTTELLNEQFVVFAKKIQTYNMIGRNSIKPQIKPFYCMAANPVVSTISTKGELYTCQSIDDTMRYGNVKEGVLIPEIPDQWENCLTTKKECETCAYLPECSAFDKCPDNKTNCIFSKEFILDRQLEDFFLNQSADNENSFEDEEF